MPVDVGCANGPQYVGGGLVQWVLMDEWLTLYIVSNMVAFAWSIVCQGWFENTLEVTHVLVGNRKIPQANHWVSTHLWLFLQDFSQHLIGCGYGPPKEKMLEHVNKCTDVPIWLFQWWSILLQKWPWGCGAHHVQLLGPVPVARGAGLRLGHPVFADGQGWYMSFNPNTSSGDSTGVLHRIGCDFLTYYSI